MARGTGTTWAAVLGTALALACGGGWRADDGTDLATDVPTDLMTDLAGDPASDLPAVNAYPPVDDLPDRPDPPDPLRTVDGSPVATAQDWRERRRPEILGLLMHYAYGEIPAAAMAAPFRVEDEGTHAGALGGTATLRNLRLRVGDPEVASIRLLLVTPEGAPGPVPAFLGLNFFGNHAVLDDPRVPLAEGWVPERGEGVVGNRATEASRGTDQASWPVADILARGYGLATLYHGDLDPDRDDDADGVQARCRPDGLTGPGDHEWGALAAWAWGLARAMDALVLEPALDPARIAVTGHSRNGKAALLAAALDPRIAMVASNQSGCMGAALSRGKTGETVAFITTLFPYWFAPALSGFADREARLPFDQHLLLSLVAPRPLLVASAAGDSWSDPAAELRAVRLAAPVFRMLGAAGPEIPDPPPEGVLAGGNPAWHVRPGGHSVGAADWAAFLDFADRAWARKP